MNTMVLNQNSSHGVKTAVLAVFTLWLLTSLLLSRLLALPAISLGLNLAFVAAFAMVFLLDTASRRLNRLVLLWAFGVLGFFILSSLGSYRPSISVSFLSTVLFGKIFMVAYLFTKFDKRDLHFTMCLLAGFHLLGVALNLVFHNLFVSLMTDVSFQLDTSRLIGFSLTANKAAAISTILALYFWFIKKNRLLFAILVITLALTVSRSLIALFIMLFLYMTYMREASAKSIAISVFVTLIAVLFILAYGNIDDTLQKADDTVNGNLKYIRAAMLFGGIQLAMENFPFGTGGGSYGSSFSRGSGVYDQLDIGDWETVINGTGIFDSGIGSILGEYGIAGLLLVILLLWLTFRNAGRGLVTRLDVAVMVFTVIFLSFFRTIVADFFYSVIVFVLFLFIKIIRERVNADAHSTGP